jgi:hypothetical protein
MGSLSKSLCGAALLLVACASDDAPPASTPKTVTPPITGQAGSGTNVSPIGASGSPEARGATPGGSNSGMTPITPGTGMAGRPAMPPPPPAGMMTTPPAGMMTTPPAPMMAPFSGPLDGDPSKPMVALDGIPCGPPKGGLGAAPPTVKITNRDVVILYPCAHEGAAVTFFLFLHGTLQEAQKVSFTMNAFAIHKLVDSHNVIVAVPKAIGTQWGNGDNGADKPHLVEVVDYVYKTFGDKFSIRSMWAQGGSWGAAYLASTFACDPQYQERLKGIQLIVGGGCPRCSNRLSCVVGQQELQLGNGMMLTPEQKEMYAKQAAIDSYATMHGCDPMMGPTDVGNTKMWSWPNCDKGWTHSYFMAPGQHADAWDAAAVLKMTEDMKATEN